MLKHIKMASEILLDKLTEFIYWNWGALEERDSYNGPFKTLSKNFIRFLTLVST